MLVSASEELAHGIDELRELARDIHPAILTEQGLGVALEVLAARAPLEVAVSNELAERLPPAIEAAAYYVVAESLTNCARYGDASAVTVRVSRRNGAARVEVADDGVGGADASRGSGLRGLADRVEALDGRLGVDSAPGEGTRVWAESRSADRAARGRRRASALLGPGPRPAPWLDPSMRDRPAFEPADSCRNARGRRRADVLVQAAGLDADTDLLLDYAAGTTGSARWSRG